MCACINKPGRFFEQQPLFIRTGGRRYLRAAHCVPGCTSAMPSRCTKKSDLPEAREQLDQATTLFREKEMNWWLEQAEALGKTLA